MEITNRIPGEERIRIIVKYAEELNSRCRRGMEDTTVVVETEDYVFCGLFDGHNGNEISLACKKLFHEEFLKNLTTNIEESIKKTFNSLDRIVCEENMQGGTTGSIIYIPKKLNKDTNTYTIYSGNVGDSETLMIQNNENKKLTVVHSTDDINEKIRVKEAGGVIVFGRVYGSINITRSIGDKYFKCSLISDPYTKTEEVRISDGKQFIIMASDGLWGFCETDEIVSIVKRMEAEDMIAEELIKTALVNGSSDNISVIALTLN
eukprot:GHVP01031323.1.p1 GENE.GHVP01031323.1~~GHVP01031323.1.p1  ORF type:complete len:263 (-),score=37.04 GHVP01031323.1:287-1075(-)